MCLDMVRFVEERDVRVAFDQEHVIGFNQAPRAFDLLDRQVHFAKVVVDVAGEE